MKCLYAMLALSLWSPPFAAQADQAEAAKHYKQAMAEYKARDYIAALADFEHAYGADPAPTLLYNIAQCHRNLGHRAKAIAYYRRYLKAKPNAADRQEIERRIEDLKNEQEKAEQDAAEPGPLAPPLKTAAGLQVSPTADPSAVGLSSPVPAPAAAQLRLKDSVPANGEMATAAPPMSTEGEPLEPTEHSLWESPWLWAGVSAVVVSGVVVAVLIANSDGQASADRVCGDVGCVIQTLSRSR